MQKPVLDRLTLKRSQPVQGQRVDAEVFWNDAPVGRLELPFGAWLKFKRLLEKGLEMDAREDHGLQLKLSIQGGQPATGVAVRVNDAVVRATLEDFAEDPEDADDLAAIAAAEAGALPPTMPSISPEEHAEEAKHEVTQGLIRSLRRENADG